MHGAKTASRKRPAKRAGAPAVTVLVTHYNQSDVLPAAVESALHQTVPCEILVVDDGSDESHRGVLPGWPAKVLRLPHAGYANAVAKGLDAVATRYVVLLNGDDVLHPAYVERLLDALRRTPEARFAYSGAYLFGPHTGIPWRGLRMHVRPFGPGLLARGNYLNATALVEASLWREMKAFDAGLPMYEDWDFWLRVAQAGVIGVAVDEPLFYYRHAKRLSRNRASRRRRRDVFRSVQAKAGVAARPEPLRQAGKRAVLAVAAGLSFVWPAAASRVARGALSRPWAAGPVFVPVSRKAATPAFPWVASSDCRKA